MNIKILKNTILIVLFTCYFSLFLQAQFTDKIKLPATEVKNQANSSTCWSFATTSFIESELLRKGKGEFDLSEIFNTRFIYPLKVKMYILMQGNCFFTAGGQPHDVMNIVKT